VKEDFTYADLATGDDEMRQKPSTGSTHAKDGNPFFMYSLLPQGAQPEQSSPRFKGSLPLAAPISTSLMELDDNSGQVVQAIRDLGLAENTFVVWTTDNGPWIDAWPDAGYTPFRGMKGTGFEGGWRVPGIAMWGQATSNRPQSWICGRTWIGGRPSPTGGSRRRRMTGRTIMASRSSSTAST
jgi:arylsulfatase